MVNTPTHIWGLSLMQGCHNAYLLIVLFHFMLPVCRFTYNNGVCCCIAAQLLYAFLAILFRMLSNNGLPILQILCMRSVFVSAASFIGIKISRQDTFFGPKKFWSLLVFRSTLGSWGMAVYFASIPFIPIGDAAALSKLTPVFALLFVCMLRWEALNSLMAIGALVCTAGGVVVTHPPLLFGGDNHWNKETMIGYSFALGSAILLGSGFLATARMGTAVTEFSVAFSSHFPAAILMGICLCFSFPSPPIWLATRTSLLLFAFLPGIFWGNLMVTRGLQLCKGIQGTTLQTSGIVFSYILSFLILGEKITVFAVVGTSVVGIGIWIQAIGKTKAQQAKVCGELDASTNGDEETEP